MLLASPNELNEPRGLHILETDFAFLNEKHHVMNPADRLISLASATLTPDKFARPKEWIALIEKSAYDNLETNCNQLSLECDALTQKSKRLESVLVYLSNVINPETEPNVMSLLKAALGQEVCGRCDDTGLATMSGSADKQPCPICPHGDRVALTE